MVTQQNENTSTKQTNLSKGLVCAGLFNLLEDVMQRTNGRYDGDLNNHLAGFYCDNPDSTNSSTEGELFRGGLQHV